MRLRACSVGWPWTGLFPLRRHPASGACAAMTLALVVLCAGVPSAWGAKARPSTAGDTPAAATFGKPSMGRFSAALGADRKRVDGYVLPVSARVSTLSVYLAGALTFHQARGAGRLTRRRSTRRHRIRGFARPGAQQIEGLLYADENGRPGALIGTSSALTFTAASPARWYSLAFSTPLRLGAGRYWIGIIAGRRAGVARYRYDRVARGGYDNANSYTSGPSSPFGSAGTDSRQISLYASYAPEPAPSIVSPSSALPPLSTPAPSAPLSPIGNVAPKNEPPVNEPPSGGPPGGEPPGEGPPKGPGVPVNSALPAISGVAQVGQVLSAGPGGWSGSPTAYAYQWERCDGSGSNCGLISSATAADYTVVSEDIGKTLRVSVVASNAAGPSPPAASTQTAIVPKPTAVQHLEYVFDDGVVSVYDMDQGQKLVKEISLPQTTKVGIRGATASPVNHMLYVSYGPDGGEGGKVLAYDLVAGTVVWEVTLTTGIDSGQVSPDGKRLYMPTGENSPSGIWNILDTSNGTVLGTIKGGEAAHNTIASADGRFVYLGGRNHNYLDVYNTGTGQVREVGPLEAGVRPFTVNGSNTLAFTTATGFDGFQVSSITTGKVLFTVSFGEVPKNFPATAPSHGISLSPDEKQVYVIDSVHSEVQVYDVSRVSEGVAPTPVGVVPVAKPGLSGEEELCAYECGRGGWVQHSLDGRFVYVGDSGEVINTATREVITTLTPLLNTKKSLEIDWANGVPVATSGRTGVGHVG